MSKMSKYTAFEQEYLAGAIEMIDQALVTECNIKIAEPERLADALLKIGHYFYEVQEDEEELL